MPTVACVIGEGGSGGAVAIAVTDRVLMQENAIYSVISPEGCAAILWRDASEAKKAAAAFKPDAQHCLELGVIDGIVPEPAGGAHASHDEAARAPRGGAQRGARGRRADVESGRASAGAARPVPRDGRLHRLTGVSRASPQLPQAFPQAAESSSKTAGNARDSCGYATCGRTGGYLVNTAW